MVISWVRSMTIQKWKYKFSGCLVWPIISQKEEVVEEKVVKIHRANPGKHLKFIKLFGQNN